MSVVKGINGDKYYLNKMDFSIGNAVPIAFVLVGGVQPAILVEWFGLPLLWPS